MKCLYDIIKQIAFVEWYLLKYNMWLIDLDFMLCLTSQIVVNQSFASLIWQYIWLTILIIIQFHRKHVAAASIDACEI